MYNKNNTPNYLRNFHQNVSVLVCRLQQQVQAALSYSQQQASEIACRDP